MKHMLQLLLLGTALESAAQSYPQFGPEINVQINGLSFDAMEPFISPDGNTLFFNSLNAGGNTNLYYATKVNDSTFTYAGLVGGCYDTASSHLDAVASADTGANFYWVSLRGYPSAMENLHRGTYSNGTVSNISRVYGDFYVYAPGWLIMDAAIDISGNELYYCNAYFNNCSFGMPCDAKLGVAQKYNDSIFTKLNTSDQIFQHVNDTNYIVYAPQVSSDHLELYYTRILNGTINSEICVSVRSSANGIFSVPQVIHSNNGFVPEAASPTADKQIIYYHQRKADGLFHIFMRYRSAGTGITENSTAGVVVFPNPASDVLHINVTGDFEVSMYNLSGGKVLTSTTTLLSLKDLATGMYVLCVKQNQTTRYFKVVKE